MTVCKNCGKEMNEGDLFCTACGASQQQESNAGYETYTVPPKPADSGSIWWGVLGFVQPIVGLILYLVWKDEKPKTALIAGKGALISAIIGIVLVVAAYAICFLVLGAAFFFSI